MNPYSNFPASSFWARSAGSAGFLDVGFDCGRKFTFTALAKFATAGSCFAQHFGRSLQARGGHVLMGEMRPSLIPENTDHGYGLFSARYGNIYTVRQLLELIQQAFLLRPVIHEFVQRNDGRWVDMLRPRAVPYGFSSIQDAAADRDFHLSAVRQLLKTMDVFVFTLGLTEAWINTRHQYCYPLVPGAIAGSFDAEVHKFKNFSVAEIQADLDEVITLIARENALAQILLTVSPVGLVATAEPRSVMVSTMASKSVLRAAVDEVVRRWDCVDYFPSYEVITGAYTKGRFFAEGGRDVTEAGVQTVMNIFFSSRMEALNSAMRPQQRVETMPHDSMDQDVAEAIEAALDVECDELYLDPVQK